MFDPSAARARVEKLWRITPTFGMERLATLIYLDEIVSDRYQLVSGLQLIRDELQFAEPPGRAAREQCGADLSLPSVVTTLAHTNCGDRIHQGELEHYKRIVGSRFGSISEIGDLKLEAFSPTGGGTDDGATLAHVTVGHQLDEPLRQRVYEGNEQSYVLCSFDLHTHVGRVDLQDEVTEISFGTARESHWREPRAACGAIVGTLKGFDPQNAVHQRLRRDLGEENFAYLSKERVPIEGSGGEATAAVAAAIVSVQGMLDTARALTTELDERGLAHLTASVTVNRTARDNTTIYLARATVFGGEMKVQGFGTDARKYGATLVPHRGEERLLLSYGTTVRSNFKAETTSYASRLSTHA